MSVIQVLYDSVDITDDVEIATARFTTAAMGEPSDAQIRVRDAPRKYAPGYFRVGGTLELLIDGTRQWDGWVFIVAREYAFAVDITTNPEATPRWWSLTGYDRNMLFTRRLTYDVANPINEHIPEYDPLVMDRTILLDVLNNWVDLTGDDLDIDTGIEEVAPLSIWEKARVVNVGAPLSEALKFITNVTGAVFYIDPDRVVRYTDDVSVTAPFGISDQPDEGEIGYREITIRASAQNMANDMFVWGAGLGGGALPVFSRYTSEESIEEHGRFQLAETRSDMWRQESVDRRAETTVNGSPQHQRGRKDDQLQVTATIFEPGLRVGQVVHVTAATFDFGITDEELDQLDEPEPLYEPSTELTRFIARIKQIESGGSPTAQNQRSGAYGYYQVMPPNWRVWGPKYLDTDPALAFARSYVHGSLWAPSTSPANQEIVGVTRLTHLHNVLGDVRRVAAGWRSGGGPAVRQPATWSRGTLKYVNSATRLLGYPETTTATVLPPVGTGDFLDDDNYRSLWQPMRQIDENFPVLRMEMTFPTPWDVRYDLTLGHQIDAAWAFSDPPTLPGPYDAWVTEEIEVPGRTYPPTGEFSDGGIEYGVTLRADYNVYINSESAKDPYGNEIPTINGVDPTFAAYSTIGILENGLSSLAWYDTNCGIGLGAHKDWESKETWFGLWPNSAWLGGWLEVNLGSYSVSGYAPGVEVRISRFSPSNLFGPADGNGYFPLVDSAYKSGTRVAVIACDAPHPIVPDDPADLPFVTEPGGGTRGVEFGTLLIPPAYFGGVDLYLGTYGDSPDPEEDPPYGYLIVSPSWQSLKPPAGKYFCDSAYNAAGEGAMLAAMCASRGPRCTGLGDSGILVLGGTTPGPSIRILKTPPLNWNVTTTETQNAVTALSEGLYQTKYAYFPGSLEISYQGQALNKGSDYYESNPALGTFTVYSFQDEAAFLVVRYRQAGADETSPPDTVVDPLLPPHIGITVYRPRPQRQGGWGTIYDSTNCNMASSAMCLDRHTYGQFSDVAGTPRSTAPNHRSYSGATGMFGTGHSDAKAAWDNGWDLTLLTPGLMTWEYFVQEIQRGRGATVFGVYSQMAEPYRKSSYSLGHAIYVNDQLPDGSFWGVDPIVGYPQFYPYNVLRTYALSFTNGRHVSAAFSRVTLVAALPEE